MSRHYIHFGVPSNYEFIKTDAGDYTLKDLKTGQLMHSRIGPEAEAREVYVKQSKLAEKLAIADSSPLTLFDLGLGIAANALAALRCAQEVGKRPLKIISFENDIEAIRFALDEGKLADEKILSVLLENKTWSDGKNSWELRVGDFLELNFSEDPEIVFFDFYSPSVCRELWGYKAFEKFSRCKNSVIVTYSASTSVRSAMMLAGFYVGYGQSTALKNETTIAAKNPDDITNPLATSWLEKLYLSVRAFPDDWTGGRDTALRLVREKVIERSRHK